MPLSKLNMSIRVQRSAVYLSERIREVHDVEAALGTCKIKGIFCLGSWGRVTVILEKIWIIVKILH